MDGLQPLLPHNDPPAMTATAPAKTPHTLPPELAKVRAAHPPAPPRPSLPRGIRSGEGHDPEEIEQRARAYLRICPPSIQGSNGSAALMAAARAVVWGFDLGAEVGAEVIAAEFNGRCVPPWSPDEIARKCEYADRDGDKPRGWLIEQREGSTVANGTARAKKVKEPKGPTVYAAGVLDFPLFRPRAAAAVDGLGDLSGEGESAADVATAAATPLALPEPAAGPEPASAGADTSRAAPAPPEVGQGEGPTTDRASTLAPIPAPTFAPGTEDDDPSRLARLFLHGYRWHGESAKSRPLYTLANKGDDWFLWRDGCYREEPQAAVVTRLASFINEEYERLHEAATEGYKRLSERGDSKAKPPMRIKLTRSTVLDSLMMVKAFSYLDSLHESFWLGDPSRECRSVVSFSNGILDLRAMLAGDNPATAFQAATPRFFTRNALTYPYRPDAPPPARWLAFLHSIWPNDPASVDLIQEWFGYLLSGDTHFQKILMIVGVTRGGKGTIREVMTRMLGAENVAAKALGDITGDFAMHSLIGKTAIVFPDARIDGREDVTRIVERMLSISGEDPQQINPKYKATYTAKLPGRFVLFSNEIPKLGDHSGAIAKRLSMPQRLQISFSGREDYGLLDALAAELPSIFAWSLEGYRRLTENRRFTSPAAAAESMNEAESLASPTREFLGDCCEFQDGQFVSRDDLFAAWMSWCEKANNKQVGSRTMFLRNLRSAYPSLQESRKGGHDSASRERGFEGIRLLTNYEVSGIPL